MQWRRVRHRRLLHARSLKIVVRPLIVGRRLSSLKEHEYARGAAQKQCPLACAHPRKPCFVDISAADMTGSLVRQMCGRFVERTGVSQCDGRMRVHVCSDR